jgi:monovalent cation/proton antiporter MnhG/PhaG subunit
MSATSIAIEIFVWIAVAVCMLSCLGVIVMDNVYQRLHYMAPVSAVSGFALLIAVILQNGWGQATIKMGLIAIILFLMNPVLTHATARAARVRQSQDWVPAPGEQMPGLDQIEKLQQ